MEKKTETELAVNGLPINLHNRNQGQYTRVLCVCMGGLLRSATLADILNRPPYNCNARAAGIEDRYSLITVDKKLWEWADEVICMEREHYERLRHDYGCGKPVTCLNVPDYYQYCQPELINVLRDRLSRSDFNLRLSQHLSDHPELSENKLWW